MKCSVNVYFYFCFKASFTVLIQMVGFDEDFDRKCYYTKEEQKRRRKTMKKLLCSKLNAVII